MSRIDREVNRYSALKEAIDEINEITGVNHTEDYIPPHKMAGFCPYDAVVAFEDEHWCAGDVEALFDEHDIKYDRITGVGRNDSRLDGERLAFVSLVDYS